MRSIKARAFLLLLCAVAALVGVVLWNKRPSTCRVPIAYQTFDGVNIYAGGAASSALETDNVRSLLAYDSASGKWLFGDSEAVGDIVAVGQGSTDKVEMRGIPKQSLLGVRPTTNRLYALQVGKDGSLWLTAYRFDGKLESKHLLCGLHYAEISKKPEFFAVSRNGDMAMTVKLNSKSDNDLFIFDSSGHLKRQLDKGYPECFDPAGKRLVLRDFDFVYEERDGRPSPVLDRGSGNIVVLDISSGRRRIIPNLTGHYGLCSVSGPGDIKWSEDGNWLLGAAEPYFLSLEAGGTVIYAADLRQDSPPWRRVVRLDSRPSWVLLTEAQRRAIRHTKTEAIHDKNN